MSATVAPTLAEWKAAQWEYLRGTVTPATIRAYSAAWNTRLGASLGSLPLDQIDAFAIETAWGQWSGAWSTKNDSIALLSRLMKRALKARLVSENPVPQIEIGREEKPDPVSRALEPAELAQLFFRVPVGGYRRLLQGLAYSGIRFGEASGLIVRDVDLDNRVIHVRRASTLDEGGRQVTDSKRPKSHGVRAVPVLDQLVPVLAEAIRGKEDLALVFPGPRGGVQTSKNLARAIKWHSWRDEIRAFPSGVNPLRFHDLRHTACTLYLRSGVPVHEVQLIMGHSSIQVTELYAHSNLERLRMAGAKLSGYLELEATLGARAA